VINKRFKTPEKQHGAGGEVTDLTLLAGERGQLQKKRGRTAPFAAFGSALNGKSFSL
jgi:hypothetical protein